MPGIELALSFVERAKTLQSHEELASLLAETTHAMGFSYFALVHRLDIRGARPPALQLHNYPDTWASRFMEDGLHAVDPVHQACLRSNVGFAWTELSTLIEVTHRQREILEEACRHGLRFGFTMPANLTGEHGACSFASERELQLAAETIMVAQLVGGFAFQTTRRLQGLDRKAWQSTPGLTERQRECLVLAVRGKTDWEISRILGLSEQTVSRHLDMARARYGAVKRMQLAAHAIFEGEISLIEALSCQVPLKRK